MTDCVVWCSVTSPKRRRDLLCGEIMVDQSKDQVLNPCTISVVEPESFAIYFSKTCLDYERLIKCKHSCFVILNTVGYVIWDPSDKKKKKKEKEKARILSFCCLSLCLFLSD